MAIIVEDIKFCKVDHFLRQYMFDDSDFFLACEDAWYFGYKTLDCSDLHSGMFSLHSRDEILHLQQITASLHHFAVTRACIHHLLS